MYIQTRVNDCRNAYKCKHRQRRTIAGRIVRKTPSELKELAKAKAKAKMKARVRAARNRELEHQEMKYKKKLAKLKAKAMTLNSEIQELELDIDHLWADQELNDSFSDEPREHDEDPRPITATMPVRRFAVINAVNKPRPKGRLASK